MSPYVYLCLHFLVSVWQEQAISFSAGNNSLSLSESFQWCYLPVWKLCVLKLWLSFSLGVGYNLQSRQKVRIVEMLGNRKKKKRKCEMIMPSFCICSTKRAILFSLCSARYAR